MISRQGNVQQANGVTTVAEAAKMLGVSPIRVFQFIKNEKLKAHKINARLYLIDIAEIRRFAKLPRQTGRPPKK